MLTPTKNMEFYFLRNFHDTRCKYDRVLSVIRMQMNREPLEGEAYIMMSRDRRKVRIFSYDNISCNLREKRFHKGYKFMKVEIEDGEEVFRINWKDVLKILDSPVIKSLKIK